MQNETTDDVAVFFDFENIAISLRNQSHQNPDFKALMDRCRQYGRVVLARAYADWGSHHHVVYALYTTGFEPVYVPTYSYGSNGQHPSKNAVDIRMAIQAMEVLYTCRHVNTFILMTGDKDFVPLALNLRRQGKKVVAFAVEQTASAYLHGAVDEIVFYGQILNKVPSKPEAAAPTKPVRKPDKPAALQAAFSLLQQTVAQALAEGKSLYAGPVKNMILQRKPDFNEKQLQNGDGHKFGRFTDFIQAAAAAGVVTVVERDDQALIYPASAAAPTKLDSVAGNGHKEAEPGQSPLANGTAPAATTNSDQQLLLDTLQTCRYPATLDEIGRHCRQVRETQHAGLPNRRIWVLLREAIGEGWLKELVGRQPGCYELVDETEAKEQDLQAEKVQ